MFQFTNYDSNVREGTRPNGSEDVEKHQDLLF